MKLTAGVLLYRANQNEIKVLLVNNGKNWSIPKGGVSQNESRRKTAKRELQEETNLQAPKKLQKLGWVKKEKRELLHCYMGELEGRHIPRASNEIRSARFFSIKQAMRHVQKYQIPLLEMLLEIVV
ncbi:NUDIX hydrolase [bacterium]|jgi:ADP-ribose pyrophosphatase YjhB (NUDIX family)|nr:NUDIX hydrolase [bacterium]